MKPFKILSLDGGVRPILMCRLIQRLLAEYPDLLEDVEVFAGTSAGAITSTIIAVSDTVREGIDRAIAFWQRWEIFEGAGFANGRTPGALVGKNAFLTHEKLYEHLREIVGEVRLKDARRKLLVPSVNVDNHAGLRQLRRWSIEIRHNLVPQYRPDSPLLADLALRSSSIPILHPVFQGHADGGLFANNPSMCALSMSIDFLSVDIKDIMVLSVGQGQLSSYLPLTQGDVGYVKWLLEPSEPIALINLVMEANLQATNYTVSRLIEERFVRIDPTLKVDIEPNAFEPPADFNYKQEEAANAVELAPIVRQLTEIGWITGANQHVADIEVSTG